MLLYALLIINVCGFAIMHYDKYLSKTNQRRIPEKNLFCLAIFGGSLGCILGMYTAHHKTRHKSFTRGLPAILLAQIALLAIGYFVLT